MNDRVEFLGLSFDNLTLAEALERIERFIRDGTPRKIFTPNVALLMWARRDESLRQVYRTCDLVTVDGMAIYYAMRLLGIPIKESVSASLLFFPLLDLAQQKGYGVFLLGAKPDVVQEAVQRLQMQFPRLRIVGWHHGYFDLKAADPIVDLIRQARPDILLLGMSSPLKERFVEKYLSTMQVPVSIGVGGMFDIAAGRARFASPLVRKLCLEWLYRLVQEPRRMWKRYLTTNPAFILLVLRELLRRKRPTLFPRWEDHPDGQEPHKSMAKCKATDREQT